MAARERLSAAIRPKKTSPFFFDANANSLRRQSAPVQRERSLHRPTQSNLETAQNGVKRKIEKSLPMGRDFPLALVTPKRAAENGPIEPNARALRRLLEATRNHPLEAEPSLFFPA